ncbi:HdeD family acid-resistance protein [Streptacidiphilus sp. MAP5-3]|uniref:HdeD family acid-resistance protein n=1 Tax=unclassified Streptacidiphilus TaxID=2643834 RepID=UPI003513331C
MDQSSDPLSGDILPGPLQQLARIAWQAVMVLGVLTLALGIVVLVWPKESLRVVGVIFGLYLLLAGVLQLIAAFGTHVSTALRVMAFVSGALSILLGLFCFRGALESILLLALWIGIGWLFRGITHIMAAASDPSMPARGWQIFMGVLTTLGGVVVLVAPFGSIAVLTAFAGAWLLVMGVMEIVTGFQVRSRAKSIPHGV